MNEDKSKWETADASSWTIGTSPNRMRFGFAWRGSREEWPGAAVVIWEETKGGWKRGPLLPAERIDYVLSAALRAMRLAGPQWDDSYFNDPQYFEEEPDA